MKKTFITQVPDKSGAFLKASRIIAEAGGNITRVSYNKAIDLHMLFIEVSATEEQLHQISEALRAIGYISDNTAPGQTILIEFKLPNVPSAVLPVLELIDSYHFNIPYISGQGSDDEDQTFKIGIHFKEPDKIKRFLDEAARLCSLRVLNYDKTQKMLDNTVFYISFANQLTALLNLDKSAQNALIADSNLIMQLLDDRDKAPYRTFSYISRFAEMLKQFKGENFCAKVHRRTLQDGWTLHMIEPPCGSNTYILEKGNALLFIDCGFPCYAQEMLKILHDLFPDFEDREKAIIPTHPDIDHCGLLYLFPDVYVSNDGRLNFALENNSLPNFREQNKLPAPYNRISKLLSKYCPPKMDTIRALGEPKDKQPISFIAPLDFHGLQLDVYAGNGGHSKGEVAIVDEKNRIVYSGDIVVNIAGFSKEQAAFNKLAPYLLTSVNTNSAMATEERLDLQEKFSPQVYTYCCGHGAMMEPAPQTGKKAE